MTKLTSSTEQDPSWEIKRFSASWRILRFLWNPKVYYRITSARNPSLSWAVSIQSIPPHATSWRYILLLSSYVRLGLPSGPFPAGFPTETPYIYLLSLIGATCLTHLILLDFITKTRMGVQ